jgi:hypothetical protein
MKSKKTLLIITFFFTNLIGFSQQIGNGFTSFIPDFSVPLLSGVYNGVNAAGATPDNTYGGFQHLLVIRHPNTTNNNQLQIASSLESNGRLFFRKISANSLISQNPVWHEVATLESNAFVGNQSITGDLKIASYSPLLVLQRNTNVGGFTQGIQTKNSDNTNNWFFGNLNGNSWIVSKGDYQNPKMTILDNGNLGIGTTTPVAKLDVMGTFATVSLNANSVTTANFRTVGVVQMAISTSGTAPYTTSLQAKHTIYDGNSYPIALNPLGGNVGIGTTTPDKKLTVNGIIHSSEVIVDTAITPDYVFQKYYTGKSELKSDYVMPTLAEIETFTKKNNHLPNVPSAQEIQQNGLSLGEMSNMLLQKIEELTLYAIEQQKEIKRLKTENENYKSLAERLSAIEKELKK